MKIDRNLLKRFKLFGSGLFIGIVFLIFFFNGKKASCAWLPNGKALEYIRSKHINYSSELKKQIRQKEVDSTTINNILLYGNISFSKSQQRQKPCQKYWIDTKLNDKNAVLHVKVCDSIATLSALDIGK